MTLARIAAKKSTPSKVIVEHRQGVRQAKAIETHRTNERARLSNFQASERVISDKQILANRTKEYRNRRSESESHTSAQKGRNVAYGAVGNATAPVRAGVNGVMLILVTMFGLIIVYSLVTQPSSTSSFLRRLSNFFAQVSTNAPLFEVTASTTTTGTGTTSTSTTSGGGSSTSVA